MTDEQIALARRAVACKVWRWMPGTRWQTSDDHGRLDDFQPEYMWCPDRALPDLTDPATLGCLLALVREAWGQPLVSVRWSVHGWRVLNTEGRAWCWRIGKGSTEAEALVAALEAAPKQGEHRRKEER